MAISSQSSAGLATNKENRCGRGQLQRVCLLDAVPQIAYCGVNCDGLCAVVMFAWTDGNNMSFWHSCSFGRPAVYSGTPEGVIAAAAMKCMGGSIQGRLYPRNDEEAQAAKDQGYDVTEVWRERLLCVLGLVGTLCRRAKVSHPLLRYHKYGHHDGLLLCLNLQIATPTTRRAPFRGCSQAMAGEKALHCTSCSLANANSSGYHKICFPVKASAVVYSSSKYSRHPPDVLLLQILGTSDLCKGDDVFFAATGVSDGDLLGGVRYFSGGATSNSIVMRSKSSTVRYIQTEHKWSKPGITNLDTVDE